MNTTKRLHSLDALRGFDMFWIIGGETIFAALAALTGWSFLEIWANQLRHVKWDGFAFYDMIFPLFLFMAGVSFPFSAKKYENQNPKGLYQKIFKRGLLLVLLGMVYNGLLNLDFANLRVASVLGRIGLAWMFAALIFINTKTTWRIIWCAGLLIIYWLASTLLQAPDFPDAGRFTPEGNIACYIDRILLPGKLYGGVFDPEGIAGTIPAISTALLGMLTGQFVSSQAFTRMKKAVYMAAAGIILVGLALGWNVFYPINKSLWSSSFVCMAGGLSLLLFALFYFIIDVKGHSKPFFFFKVIGVNSITIYLARIMINFWFTSQFFFRGIVGLFPENWVGLMNSVFYVAVCWLFLYFLYRQKIFLKV